MKATIVDIAEKLGVSPTTVSNVIHNRDGRASEETRRRVLSVIKELNYRPNRVARSLRFKKSQVIGYVLPSIMNPVFPAIAQGIEDEVHDRGYSLIICNAGTNPLNEDEYLDVLMERQAEGIILSPILTGSATELPEERVPMVLVERTAGIADFDSVLVDNQRGGFLATNHLIKLGHRRIGLIGGPFEQGQEAPDDRLKGHLQALASHGIEPDPELIRDLGPLDEQDESTGSTQAIELLKLKNPPTAIFVISLNASTSAFRVLERRGLKIPDEMSIVAYDRDVVQAVTSPQLATIKQPLYELGRTAARMLMERIEDPSVGATRRVVLAPTLELGESTAAPRATSRLSIPVPT